MNTNETYPARPMAIWYVNYSEDGRVWTKWFETQEEAEAFRKLCVHNFGIWASLPGRHP